MSDNQPETSPSQAPPKLVIPSLSAEGRLPMDHPLNMQVSAALKRSLGRVADLNGVKVSHIVRSVLMEHTRDIYPEFADIYRQEYARALQQTLQDLLDEEPNP